MAEFFSMGGHGAYVWPAWGLCLVMALANAWWARRKRRQACAKVRARWASR